MGSLCDCLFPQNKIFELDAQGTDVVQNSFSVDNFLSVLVRKSDAMHKTSESVLQWTVCLLHLVELCTKYYHCWASGMFKFSAANSDCTRSRDRDEI